MAEGLLNFNFMSGHVADEPQSIIPNLLDPLQYTPTTAVLPHYRANLSALLRVMKACRTTGRVAKWRGQIIDVLSRLWVQLDAEISLAQSESQGEL
jgi:hypothetical protein